MQIPLSIEELIVDDSFINYCYGRNLRDIQYWENYALIFPDQQANVEEAKSIVLGLSSMFLQEEQETALAELKLEIEKRNSNIADQFLLADEIKAPKRILSFRRMMAYAVAAGLMGFGIFLFVQSSSRKQKIVQPLAEVVKKQIPLLYETNYGEKKTIWLPDSSKVILNAKSTLRIDSNFDAATREVYLTGEALFDVTHNPQKPFVVNMNQFEVKVLGTLFNVKAYPEDKVQEASLIRGKVQVIFKNTANRTIFLNPNEKAIIPNKEEPGVSAKPEADIIPPTVNIPTITGLTINSKDSTIVETSWVYDRLDIYDKTFSQIRTDLERLYNINIDFKDRKVANYRFSATFEKETIEQILKALQLSYPFHYTIDNNNITISK